MARDGQPAGGWLRKLTQTLSGEPQDREDLIESLHDARERGLIDGEAMGMLEGVLDVEDLQVRDIMVPRAQMVCVSRDESRQNILETVVESGHSRFPVVDGDRDDIAGILLAKDLLRLCQDQGHEDHFDIREFMRPAVFIPESKRLNVLLKEFRDNRNHMALVVDEYGGVAGLVTIEDVIEQIIGEIDDEFDVDDELDIRREAKGQYAVRGVTRLEQFNEYFGAGLTDEDFDTVAGLVMKTLGRMPRRGESLILGGLEFRVMRADRRRVDMLRVTIAAEAEPPGDRDSSG